MNELYELKVLKDIKSVDGAVAGRVFFGAKISHKHEEFYLKFKDINSDLILNEDEVSLVRIIDLETISSDLSKIRKLETSNQELKTLLFVVLIIMIIIIFR